MGMLRTLVIVGGAIALMPSPPPDPAAEPAASGPGAFAYVAAAAETVADVRGFCERNPNVCSTAGSLAQTLEGKAKYSAKLVYEWANEATSDGRPAALPQDLADAGPALPADALLDAEDPQNTLTVADARPAWRKPKLQPEG